MSRNSGSQSEILSTLGAYVESLRQKRQAFEHLQDTSLILLGSAASADPKSLDAMVTRRAEACLELGRLLSGVSVAEPDISSFSGSENTQIRQLATQAQAGAQELESLSEQILATQEQCEQVLRSALADTSKKLREAVQHKRVNSAYKSPRSERPQFLDKRK